MVTETSGRRGFLRNVALAVGALLLGVGRSAGGREVVTDQHCVYCNGKCCKKDKRCSCPPPTVPLDWRTDGGHCVECYESEADKAEAIRGTREMNRRDGRNRESCTYCTRVRCGYYRSDSNGNGSSGQFSYEDPLGVFDSIGAGCYDPVTRETSPWSEPGDACSDLDAQETAPENT